MLIIINNIKQLYGIFGKGKIFQSISAYSSILQPYLDIIQSYLLLLIEIKLLLSLLIFVSILLISYFSMSFFVVAIVIYILLSLYFLFSSISLELNSKFFLFFFSLLISSLGSLIINIISSFYFLLNLAVTKPLFLISTLLFPLLYLLEFLATSFVVLKIFREFYEGPRNQSEENESEDKVYNRNGIKIICDETKNIFTTVKCGCKIDLNDMKISYCKCLLSQLQHVKCPSCYKLLDLIEVENILSPIMPREKFLILKLAYRRLIIERNLIKCPLCQKYNFIGFKTKEEFEILKIFKCNICSEIICLKCGSKITSIVNNSFMCENSACNGRSSQIENSSNEALNIFITEVKSIIDQVLALIKALFQQTFSIPTFLISRTKRYVPLSDLVAWTRRKCWVINGKVHDEDKDNDDYNGNDDEDDDCHPFRAMLSCGCPISLNAMYESVEISVRANNKICCPSCSAKWKWAAVEYALSFHVQKSELLELIINYQENIIKNNLSKCPLCFSFIKKLQNTNIIKCSKCLSTTCFQCKEQLKDEATCSKCQPQDKIKILAASKIVSCWGCMVPELRACPNCHQIIKYNGGCKRMFCTTCRCEFCYLCLHWISDSAYHTSAACLCGGNCKVAPKQQSLEYNLQKDKRCDGLLPTQLTQPQPQPTRQPQAQPSRSWCTIS